MLVHRMSDILFNYYNVIQSDIRWRVLFYIVPTFMVLVLVALMVLPVGIPVIGHVSSYWWAEAANQEFVGQANKWFWYRRASLTATFLTLVVGEIWLWRLMLYSRKMTFVALLLAYVTFVAAPIGTQYLVMGDWKTLGAETLRSPWGGSPSYMTIASRIDSVPRYLSHIKEYAGVDGQLLGPMMNKAPAYVLTYYAFDQLNLRIGHALGLGPFSLPERGILVAVGFLLVIGLSIFPLYLTAQRLFSRTIALTGVMIFSFNPMVSAGFTDPMAWNHLLMLPVTALVLMFLLYELDRVGPLTVAALTVAAIAVLVNWESLALLTFCLIYIAVRFRWTTDNSIRKMGSQAICIGTLLLAVGMVAIVIVWLTTGLNLIRSFWDSFLVMHVRYMWRAYMLVGGGAFYLISLPANVIEFFFWVGIPISLQFVLALVRSVKSESGMTKRLIPGRLLVIVFALFLGLLDISGTSTETSRLWAFLTPVLLLSCLYELGAAQKEKVAISAGLAIFALQAIQFLVCKSVFFW